MDRCGTLVVIGVTDWAKSLDERYIDRAADMHCTGRVPPLRYRVLGFIVGVALGAFLLFVAEAPLLAVMIPLAAAPAALAWAWPRRRRG